VAVIARHCAALEGVTRLTKIAAGRIAARLAGIEANARSRCSGLSESKLAVASAIEESCLQCGHAC
jgi:ribosomal protein L22